MATKTKEKAKIKSSKSNSYMVICFLIVAFIVGGTAYWLNMNKIPAGYIEYNYSGPQGELPYCPAAGEGKMINGKCYVTKTYYENSADLKRNVCSRGIC